MVKKQIIDTYDVNSNKIKVIYNGIELKNLNYPKSFNKLSKEFLIKEGQPVLLYAPFLEVFVLRCFVIKGVCAPLCL